MNKWILTDPSTQQYGRKVRDKVYEFKEKRITDPISNEKEDYQSVIDLNDYTTEEIKSTLNAYGLIIEDTEEWIIAECLFEQEY
jgi:hypothetical protein